MALQDLNQMFSIVKPSDGTPTDYFMRLLRDRGETTQSLEEQVVDLDTQIDTLTTQLAGKADKITNLSAGSGLAGGGDLSADRSFSLNAGIDLLTDVDTSTTPPTDGQALLWVAADSLWKPGTVSGGGGGGSSTERTRVKPVTSNFTLLNPGTATMTDGTQGIVLNAPNPGGNNIRFIASNTAPPAAPYSVIMRSQPVFYNAGLSRYGNSLILRNSTTGAIIITGDYDQGFLAQGWADYFNFGTGLYGPQGQDNAPPWQKVENDGTNLKFFMSSDGQDWYEYFSTAIASYIGSVDQVGFGCFVSGNTVCDIFQSFEVV